MTDEPQDPNKAAGTYKDPVDNYSEQALLLPLSMPKAETKQPYRNLRKLKG